MIKIKRLTLWQKKRKCGTSVKQAIDKTKWVVLWERNDTGHNLVMFKITHLTYKISDILNSIWFFICRLYMIS